MNYAQDALANLTPKLTDKETIVLTDFANRTGDRGEAYLSAGQGGAAAAEFQKILDHNGIVWNCWTGALAHLGMARANALQARTSQGAAAAAARVRALTAYQDFLAHGKMPTSTSQPSLSFSPFSTVRTSLQQSNNLAHDSQCLSRILGVRRTQFVPGLCL